MKRSIDRLTNEPFDLLVIGGGIHGAGIARDAARRGLRVALLEKGDFGEGTSSRSSRLIHGGLRYLAQLQVGVVRECLRERTTLLARAPHLVRPLGFLLPFYRPASRGGGGRGRFSLRLGLRLYDSLARRGPLPPHRLIGPEEALAMEPALRRAGLLGAALYWDAWCDDRRLVIANLVAAARAGAVLANHAEVLTVEPGLIVHARDGLTREGFRVRAKAIANAAGPLADEVAKRVGLVEPPRLRLSKGAHLVFPATRSRHAVLLQSPIDGRVIFVLPDLDTTVVGTTETAFTGDPLSVAASTDDVSYLLDSVRELMPEAAFSRERLLYAFAGVRPLLSGRSEALGALSRQSRIVEARIDGGRFLSVLGGKLTAYRALAERVVNRLTERPCTTREDPLPGACSDVPEDFERTSSARARDVAGVAPDIAGHLLRRYGSEWDRVLEHARGRGDLLERLEPGRPEIGAEVVHAVRCEMALQLADVILGRLTLGRSAGQGIASAARVAQIMAAELGWDERRTEQELRDFHEKRRRRHEVVQGRGGG
ncbi:MAG: glycerol-3-phosphate dehydrogenase/oxidase [Planctomycetota bacterium]